MSIYVSRAVPFIALLAPLLALAGCPEESAETAPTGSATTPAKAKASPAKSRDAKPAPAADKGGAASPQAAFEKLKKGANGRDYRTFFSVLTTDSQDQMLVGVLIGSGLSLAPVGSKARPNKKKELDAIFEKHGVKDSAKPTGLSDPSKMMAQMSQELAAVKDRAGLFDDLMKYLEKTNLGQKRYEILSLENLEQNGDVATATVKTKGRPQRPVEFRKLDGRWFIHLTKWP